MAFFKSTALYAAVRSRAGEKTASRADIACSIALMMLFVLVLSLFFFSNQSLRLDESQSLWQTSHSIPEIFRLVAEDIHVPLYHVMLHFWQMSFGSDVATARMLSLIFYLAMIPTIYFLGKLIYNPSVGLFGAFLAAISPFMNWYGDEIRMYTLFALLTLVNQYFFMCLFLKRDENGNTPRRYWIGYAVSMYFGMFSHYFFAFNMATQAIFYLLYREYFPKKSFRKFILVLTGAVILFAPWAWYVISLGTASNTQPQLIQPSTIDLFNTFSQFIFGFQVDSINTILVSLWPMLVLLIFLSLRRNQKVTPQTAYLFFCLFVPILLAYSVSLFIKPIYLTRYLILSLPPLYLLLSWVLTIYSKKIGYVIRFGLVAVMLVTLGIEMASAATPVKENYKDAALYLNTHVTPQDIVVLSAPFTIYPVEYYYRGTAEIQTLPIWDQTAHGAIPAFSADNLPKEVDQLKANHQTLWLLLSYDQGYEKDIKLYFDTHFERTASIPYSQDLNLYTYKLRYDQANLSKVLQNINTGTKNSVPATLPLNANKNKSTPAIATTTSQGSSTTPVITPLGQQGSATSTQSGTASSTVATSTPSSSKIKKSEQNGVLTSALQAVDPKDTRTYQLRQ